MVPCKVIPSNTCSAHSEKVVFMQSIDREKVILSLKESKKGKYTTEGLLQGLEELTNKLEQEIKILEK